MPNTNLLVPLMHGYDEGIGVDTLRISSGSGDRSIALILCLLSMYNDSGILPSSRRIYKGISENDEPLPRLWEDGKMLCDIRMELIIMNWSLRVRSLATR